MKKYLYLLIFFSFTSYGQILFEKGYFINNKGEKTNCLIKNIDWNESPTKFSYKKTEKGSKKSADISTVKEFGIYNTSKYLRFEIDIDNSSSESNKLSDVKDPDFNKTPYFLKALVEGKPSLYLLKVNNKYLYFIKTEEGAIERLIQESFFYTKENIVIEDNTYRDQLELALKNDAIKSYNLKNLGYNKKELVKIFVTHNKGENVEYKDFDTNKKKKLFHLSILSGGSYSTLSLSLFNARTSENANFDSKTGVFIGLESELVLPFNNNTWSVLIEPSYHSYKSIADANYSIEYKRIELAMGFRYSLFFNEKSKIYINSHYITNIDFSSRLNSPDHDIKPQVPGNFTIGTGYFFRNYRIGARYDFTRTLLAEQVYWTSDFNKFSIILGYTIF